MIKLHLAVHAAHTPATSGASNAFRGFVLERLMSYAASTRKKGFTQCRSKVGSSRHLLSQSLTHLLSHISATAKSCRSFQAGCLQSYQHARSASWRRRYCKVQHYVWVGPPHDVGLTMTSPPGRYSITRYKNSSSCKHHTVVSQQDYSLVTKVQLDDGLS